MLRCLLITLTFVFNFAAVSAVAEDVRLFGTLGSSKVEFLLTRQPGQDDNLTGQYRYGQRDSWLTLKGRAFGGQAIFLEESWQNEKTGELFLEFDGDRLNGFWVAGEKQLPVEISADANRLEHLHNIAAVTDVIYGPEGAYKRDIYWINEIWAPNLEIGYNGGTVSVWEIDPMTIDIQFEFVVGPTYHFAVFKGSARKLSEGVYLAESILDFGDEPCVLLFDFRYQGLKTHQFSPGYHCGFGARAHAEFNLDKISDTPQILER